MSPEMRLYQTQGRPESPRNPAGFSPKLNGQTERAYYPSGLNPPNTRSPLQTRSAMPPR